MKKFLVFSLFSICFVSFFETQWSCSQNQSMTYPVQQQATYTQTFTPTTTISITPTLTSTLTLTSTPTSTSTPVAINQTLWANGTTGSWLGYNIVILTSDTANTVSVSNSLNGDTQALQLAYSASGVHSLDMSIPVPENIAGYYTTGGHLQFDIRLEQPISTYSAQVTFSYLNQSNQSADFPINTNTLSQSNFIQLALPVTNFSNSLEANINTPFQVSFTNSVISGPLLTLDSVKWTAN